MEMSDSVQGQTNVIKIKKEPPCGSVTEVTEGNNTVDITGDADSSNIRDPTVVMIKTEDKLPESGSSNATKPADEGNVQTADAQTAQTSTSDTRPDEQQASAKTRKMKQEEERQKLQLLVSHFSENQLNHYEMYRRAAFPKAAIKRLMQSVAGATISQNVVIAMSGIAKVYVGEIVEEALEVKSRFGEHGPLQPKHIREAVRILRQSNAIPNTKYKKHSRLT